MTDLNTTQMMLARHAIGWSFIPPSLTNNLPTTLSGARSYLQMATNQQTLLAAPLAVDAAYLTKFIDDGGRFADFFEHQRGVLPWYGEEAFRPHVLRDLRMVNDGVRRLKNIVDIWMMEQTELSSEAPLSPFRSVRDLNQVFGSLHVFSSDLSEVFSDCPRTGVEKFYCRDERRRRGLSVS